MNRNEAKLRGMLARAKGGHRRVLQGRLDAMMRERGTVEASVEAPVETPKKKAKKKK